MPDSFHEDRSQDSALEAPPIVRKLMALARSRRDFDCAYRPYEESSRVSTVVREIFQEFEQQVAENDVQISRYDFLKMEAFYDGSLVGPSGATAPSYGSTGLEIIFKYYSMRRQLGSGQPGATFSEINLMNSTIDADEIYYFFKDFFPGVFSNREVVWIFKRTNQMNGISDENVASLDFDEFVGLICIIGMQLYRGCTPEVIAAKIGERLGLNDPRSVNERMRYLARSSGACGAWKTAEGTKVTRFDRKVRAALGNEKERDAWILPLLAVQAMKDSLLSFPALKIPEFIPFGRFIAMALPRSGVRHGQMARFRITLSNLSTKIVEIHFRIHGIPFVSLKYGARRAIAPGMSEHIDLFVEKLPVGEHLGGLVFSAEEGGPELFRCPIYIRVCGIEALMLETQVCEQIALRCGSTSVAREMGLQDENIGRISPDIFFRGVQNLQLGVPQQHMDALLSKLDVDHQGNIEYDDFLAKVTEYRSGHSTLGETSQDLLLTTKMDKVDLNIFKDNFAVPLKPRIESTIGSTFGKNSPEVWRNRSPDDFSSSPRSKSPSPLR